MGTSKLCQHRDLLLKDHPHACGDKYGLRFKYERHLGSSPRVWGQERCYSKRASIHRIIPTRVGTSIIHSCLVRLRQDHPHACGDKYLNYRWYSKWIGSSPRVWGQGGFLLDWESSLRIIPTRVGTSQQFICKPCRNQGSSPRVWGQAVSDLPTGKYTGIIPTRVGTS